MQGEAVARARAALARGDVLVAYDEAERRVEHEPGDLEARFLAALALARAGAREGARAGAWSVLERVRRAADVPLELREDAAALVARLAKDDALATAGDARREALLRAADLYDAVAAEFGRPYSAVNAATLLLLAGDRERAHDGARRTLQLIEGDRRDQPHDDYWRVATIAEAALVLGDVDGAHGMLAYAASLAGDDLAARATTRRQLRLVCNSTGVDEAILDELAPPLILHFSGHLIDAEDASPRFPSSREPDVARAIAAYLDEREVGFGYGSLASGSDIVIAEALLERAVQLEVVLPFASDEFARVSVAPAGEDWTARYRRCLDAAASVVCASDSSYTGGDELFGYAGRIAMGHALNHAAFLDAPVEQLVVWDGHDGSGVAGTGHDVAAWRRAGGVTHVIELPRQRGRTDAAPHESAQHEPDRGRQIGAILFADLCGFSRLRDEHFPVFVDRVLGPFGAQLDRFSERVLWRNSWGDAIAAVFTDVVSAADCALGLHDALEVVDLTALGLPPDLKLRIGAHVGPVMAMTDPVGHRLTYWGRELTRAARIEPRTPEGEIYVTDSFAALLALEPHAPFACEYVGRITTAKDFETIPMYRLSRRSAPSAREAR